MTPRILVAALLTASESLIAAAIRSAQLTQDDLAPMVGKTLKLHLADLDVDFWIICGDETWWLATESQGEADVALSGTLGNFVETARSMTKTNSPLIFDGLDIRGSVGVLQKMQTIVKKMNLDWRDTITRVLNPVPAKIMIQTLTTARTQWLASRQSIQRQTTEFISNDQKIVISKNEIDEYASRLTDLLQRIDRLDAQLRRIKTDE